MKLNIFKYILMLSTIFVLSSCEDFFKVDTDNVLDSGDYIATDSEMYAGYIGVITKVQIIGDKVIYLTDTRGELLEPTSNASNELVSVYNYNTDLTGNTYADPAPYYEVIIACNDYLKKMFEYKKEHSASIDKDHFEALISSTLRIKAWVYLTIGKIYGEAVWFDDPMIEKVDISKFPVKTLDEVVLACKDLLTNGVEGIDGKKAMTWKEWIDPETPLAESKYRYWEYMTPDYFALYAELCLWSGDYQQTIDAILPELHVKFASTNLDGNNIYWLRSSALAGKFARIWDGDNKAPSPHELVSGIFYNYQYNQTNSLLKHFGTESPNEYLLSPSEAGRERFSDPDFNNLGAQSEDPRMGITFRKNGSQWVIQKFRPNGSTRRLNAYEDDVPIYIYRSTELHFMLAEALNQLGRYSEAAAIINMGVGGAFPQGGVTWPGFNDDWTAATQHGVRKYPNAGVRGTFFLGEREFYKKAKEAGDPVIHGEDKLTDVTTDAIAKKQNDLAILDEMMLEFPAEGKNYSAMIRVAKRYNDYNIIADRVTPKYTNAEEIKAKILDGGYFIKWDLKNK